MPATRRGEMSKTIASVTTSLPRPFSIAVQRLSSFLVPWVRVVSVNGRHTARSEARHYRRPYRNGQGWGVRFAALHQNSQHWWIHWVWQLGEELNKMNKVNIGEKQITKGICIGLRSIEAVH